MQLSNELFFALFSIVMVVAVIWLMRSVSRYKAWANSRDEKNMDCLLYTSPSPRDQRGSRMPSSA